VAGFNSGIRVLLGSWLLWAGAALFVSGPGLLLVAATIMELQGDHDAPIGPLIWATVVTWPSIIMILAGLAIGIFRLLVQLHVHEQGDGPPDRPNGPPTE
jgi:hypothetical protein